MLYKVTLIMVMQHDNCMCHKIAIFFEGNLLWLVLSRTSRLWRSASDARRDASSMIRQQFYQTLYHSLRNCLSKTNVLIFWRSKNQWWNVCVEGLMFAKWLDWIVCARVLLKVSQKIQLQLFTHTSFCGDLKMGWNWILHCFIRYIF